MECKTSSTCVAHMAGTCAALEKKGAITMFTSALKGQAAHQTLIVTALTFLVRTREVGFTSAKNNAKLLPALVFAVRGSRCAYLACTGLYMLCARL